MRRNRLILAAAVLVAAPFLLFEAAHRAFPLPRGKLSPPGSRVVFDRRGEVLRVYLAPDGMWRLRSGTDGFSEHLERSVLAYEDRFFRYHAGINPLSIARALLVNIRAGRVVQGGSTITMQLARLMEPKERTFRNKIIEAFRSLQIERTYTKKEILALYLDMAPYGGNVVGAGAAARIYFDKSVERLSIGEAALLAAIPKNPNANRPDLDPEAARRARGRVLERMVARGAITEAEARRAETEPIEARRYSMPFRAPHLSDMLAAKRPERERLETTIDGEAQAATAGVLARHAAELARRGITNAAAVVLDVETGELLALIGSLDFFDDGACGQVNGATAPRSPGSALKPFLYALGLDQGLITPSTILADAPVDYSGYRPVNYDGRNSGAVTAEEALERSLNVPAVNLYARLGNRGLHSFLRDAGVTTLPEGKEHYGLSLALGGAGITLLELTNVYRGVAAGGLFSPCIALRDEPRAEGRRLLGEGACFILGEMLTGLRRPELPAVWEQAIHIPKVAWKTGTSYGHRDAWSIGYDPRHAVGVWVGNFDGSGVPALVGAETAAPILFEIFAALDRPDDGVWFARPPTVAERTVCAASGLPPNADCPTHKKELFLPGLSPQTPCDVHRRILVDRKTGYRLCPHCRMGRDCEERIVALWPPEIATWMERNGHPIDEIPEHDPDCSRLANGAAPLIRSPIDGSVYRLRANVDRRYQKVLLDAQVANGTGRIFWFLDGRLVYSGAPRDDLFISPDPGRHTLLCMDDEGRSRSIDIVVRDDPSR
ncbi:MAG: penicillin-binding protein 1C [Candidatus Eisenbacteria bacterium]|nr:penicillin-binding protein 1C [Candidatus Eisenbacteria bacterium]